MSRENMRMTADASYDHEEFRRLFGSEGNCSCHISPPCNSCIHPGNPINMDEDDSAWEPDLAPRYVLPDDVPPPVGMTREQFSEWSWRTCGYAPPSGSAARLFAARLHLRALGLAHSGSTPALLTMAGARRPSLSVSQLLARPAGHRVTLTRRHLIGKPLVITTNANPSHAHALRDLRYQFKATTGREYMPRRGDTITHEVTA